MLLLSKIKQEVLNMLCAQRMSGQMTTTITVNPLISIGTVTLADKKTELPFYCSCQLPEPKMREFDLLQVNNFGCTYIIKCSFCNSLYNLYEFETEIKKLEHQETQDRP